MPYSSLIEIVTSIKSWLRKSWAISSSILFILLVCFLFWSQSTINDKARLTQESIQQLFDNAFTLINSPMNQRYFGYTRFRLSKEGVIRESSPNWLVDVNLSETELFEKIEKLNAQYQHTDQDNLNASDFFIIMHSDLDAQAFSPHLVFLRDDGFEIVSIQHFSSVLRRNTTIDNLLTNDKNEVIYSPYLHRIGTTVSNLGLTIREGRFLFANAYPLGSVNQIKLVIYEDVSGIAFMLCFLLMLFVTSLVYVNTRIKSVFQSLYQLRDEFDQITDLTAFASEESLKKLHQPAALGRSSMAAMKQGVLRLKSVKFQFQENIRVISLVEQLIDNNIKLTSGIKEQEERFNLLTGLSPVGVFHADIQGTIKYVNKRLCDMLRVNEEQLLGNRWENFIHPEDKKAYLSDREAHHGQVKKQVRCLQTDGSERFVLSEEVFQLDSSKQFSGIIGAIVDITDEKLIETALKESEARWQFALDGSGNGVWDRNLLTNEAYFSPQWAKILGYQEDEIAPSVDEWISRVHPDDFEDTDNAVKKHLEGLTPYYQSEHRLLCKDGQYKWVLDRGKVIEWSKEGNPIRMIGTHSDITERKSNEEKIQHLAYHDSLTGLPNRAYLQEELFFLLSQLKRSEQNTALLFLDIDHFKMINDSMGHLVGDQMLQQVASRLKNSIREEDFLVRLGGDEFVILLGNPSEDSASVYRRAKKVTDNVLLAFKEPFEFSGQKVVSGTSIGIVIFPEDGKSVKEVLQHADTAMYQAKKDGRNTLHYYRQELATAIKRRLYIENGLRTAITENAFTLFYQPKVSLSSDKVVGAEALIRWTHQGESISPAEFIPIAEESGLILSLGAWVMEKACQQMVIWRNQGFAESLQYMAINVSPHQFTQPGFVEEVEDIIKRTNVDPRCIELELTEGVFMQNVDKSKEKMFELKAQGIRFAVDDFGTGYSSLAYLKQLPVDILKVDQAFVRDLEVDPNDASIVKTVLAMAHGLGMEAVAEGVESEKHIEFLKDEGCKYFQGYYFSKPLSVEAFEKLLQNYQS